MSRGNELKPAREPPGLWLTGPQLFQCHLFCCLLENELSPVHCALNSTGGSPVTMAPALRSRWGLSPAQGKQGLGAGPPAWGRALHPPPCGL